MKVLADYLSLVKVEEGEVRVARKLVVVVEVVVVKTEVVPEP